MLKQVVRDFCYSIRECYADMVVDYSSRFGLAGSTNNFNRLTVYLLCNLDVLKYTHI